MSNQSNKNFFYYNFNYIDPIAETTNSNMKMIVSNQIIHKIGSDIKKPENSIEIDLKNQWILPGLINNHCHLSGSGKPLPKFIKSDRLINPGRIH